MIGMTTELGVDGDRRDKWQHILDHLSEPINNDRIFGIVVDFVWPSGVIGLDADRQILQRAHREICDWPDSRWITSGSSVPHVFAAAARVGYDPEIIFSMMRRRVENSGLGNLWISQDGGGVESCSGITAGLNEMLLQSHEQVVRLFPVWPTERDARFARLRAVGAFLVSSVYEDFKVQYVLIESEKGCDCTLLNLWPGQAVTLHRNDTRAETLRGERITFKTTRGEVIALGSQGVSLQELQGRVLTAANAKP